MTIDMMLLAISAVVSLAPVVAILVYMWADRPCARRGDDND